MRSAASSDFVRSRRRGVCQLVAAPDAARGRTSRALLVAACGYSTHVDCCSGRGWSVRLAGDRTAGDHRSAVQGHWLTIVDTKTQALIRPQSRNSVWKVTLQFSSSRLGGRSPTSAPVRRLQQSVLRARRMRCDSLSWPSVSVASVEWARTTAMPGKMPY